MRILIRRPKPSLDLEYLKYLAMVNPGSEDSSTTVRISNGLENAIREFAKRYGTTPYIIRNIAIALGLAVLENLSQDQIRTFIDFYVSNNASS